MAFFRGPGMKCKNKAGRDRAGRCIGKGKTRICVGKGGRSKGKDKGKRRAMARRLQESQGKTAVLQESQGKTVVAAMSNDAKSTHPGRRGSFGVAPLLGESGSAATGGEH